MLFIKAVQFSPGCAREVAAILFHQEFVALVGELVKKAPFINKDNLVPRLALQNKDIFKHAEQSNGP